MREVLIFLVFIPFSTPFFAQYEHILNNPNVIWAAEMTLDFLPEPEYSTPDSVEQYQRYSIPLKLVTQEQPPRSEWGIMFNPRLEAMVFDQMQKGGCRAKPGAAAALTEAECLERLGPRDTITTFDPETYAPKTVVVYNCDLLSTLSRVRARQLLYFDQKDGNFKIFTLAIAPVLYRSLGNSVVSYVPFWVDMPSKNDKKMAWNASNITWVRRLLPLNPPDPAALKALKDFKPPVLRQFIERAKNDKKYIIANDFQLKPLSEEDREKIFSHRDTVTTFDVETYEEVIQIVDTGVKAEDIKHLKLVQDWCWDARKKRFYVRLHAFAPATIAEDGQGNFRFYKTMFWRRLP